jgi:hypothetical protein
LSVDRDSSFEAAGPAPLVPTTISGQRATRRILGLGALAVVLAATTLNTFDLDRFFVPKELVLHAAALLAGLFAWRALARGGVTRAERLLAAFVAVSALSALFGTNHWLALRALALTASGLLVFRAARAVGRPLAGALALAVVAAAVTSLMQTYGLDLDVFSVNRAPGGTLGNRNFVAHVAAFGLPVVLFSALLAARRVAFLRGAVGAALVTASLVLTRSRAAWLAFAAVLLVVIVAMLVAPVLRRDARTWRRLGAMVLVAAAAVGLALVLPNALRWRGRNPYMQTVKRVADYSAGSGHGRLVQYTQSLKMALHHSIRGPLLGVGPGNWAVVYPAFAVRDDPSLDQSEAGVTSNPWPSSDWIACLAERGLAATVLLALALLSIAAAGLRQLRRAASVEEALAAMALLGTLAAAGVAGTFDAVLLLAVPALLVWATLGALLQDEAANSAAARWPRMALAMMLLLSAAGVYRSTMQLVVMKAYVAHSDRASLDRASSLDPGNYRLQLRLARMGGRSRCAHARAARELFPNAAAARAAAAGCE